MSAVVEWHAVPFVCLESFLLTFQTEMSRHKLSGSIVSVCDLLQKGFTLHICGSVIRGQSQLYAFLGSELGSDQVIPFA
jgi:hypothetical protein